MKVILLHNVKKIGQAGEVVDVADGYANGFLLPKKLAKIATKEALASLSKEQSKESAKQAENAKALKDLFDSINGTAYHSKAQANEKGSLFAAVQAKDVAAIMHTVSATDFDAQYIALENPIKELGEYKIPIVVDGHEGEITLTLEKK